MALEMRVFLREKRHWAGYSLVQLEAPTMPVVKTITIPFCTVQLMFEDGGNKAEVDEAEDATEIFLH
jgi:hypothetical protein